MIRWVVSANQQGVDEGIERENKFHSGEQPPSPLLLVSHEILLIG